MRFAYPLLVFISLVINGCNDPNQQNQPNVYYDVSGFVKQQIASLSVQKPPVTKIVSLNNSHNQQNTRDINWNRELELFMQADINKPALRSSYQISRPDSLTFQYTLKNSEERLTVRSLMVNVDSVTHRPRRIEAVLQTNNPLYSSERHLLLESGLARPDQASGQWRVRHYKLSGFQKLPYFDKNSFLVEGRLP
ncbi:hypothetical protein [Spirosoma areae]